MCLESHFVMDVLLNGLSISVKKEHRHSSNTRRALWAWFLVGTSRSAVRGKLAVAILLPVRVLSATTKARARGK